MGFAGGAFFGGGGGGGSQYTSVANYAALPAAAGVSGQTYEVLASQGTYFVNRKPAGLYYSDGVNWNYLAEATEAYFADNVLQFYDNSDNSKKLAFELSTISAATTRTATWPDKSGTVAMTSDITGGLSRGQAYALNIGNNF